MRFDTGKFDFEPDDFLPIVAHRSPHVVMLLDGSYKATVLVPGFGYEMNLWDERNIRRRQWNTLTQNIGDDNVTMTVHLVRHHTVPRFVEGRFRSEFAARLNRRYRASIDSQAMTTEWLISLIVSPRFTPLKPLNRLKQRLGLRRPEAAPAGAVEDSVQALEDRVYILMSYLRQAGARRLGLRTNKLTGVQYSEIAEADRLILTGEWSPVPNINGALGSAVYNQRAVCGRRGIEIAAFGGPRYGMMLGLKQYMNQTRTGMLDELLYAEFPFVLSQSFHFISRAAAGTSLWLRETRMRNAMERSEKEMKGLAEAAQDVLAGAEVRGNHHFSLAVYGDTFDQMLARSGEAGKIIGNMGAVPAMEDRGSFAAYFSQLGGNPDWLKTRPGELGSRNFSAFVTLDGVPTGSRKGWWGEAMIRFVTAHGTIYDFCLHVGEVGHTMVLGRTGRGKTALLTFLATALEKAMLDGGTTVYFDKDRGAEPMIRACEGRYLQFRRGVSSGCAPLIALDNTPENCAFLEFWLSSLIVLDGRGPIRPDEIRRLSRGVARQMNMPAALRSFGGIREFLGYEDPIGAGARFDRWCRGNALGWAFDNEADDIRVDSPLLGFDLTKLFDEPVVCAATSAYLIHRLNGLIDGRRIAVIWDEIRFSLQVPVFAQIIDDFALVLRKKNGVLIIATQEPDHILRTKDGTHSSVGSSLISQCVNKFVFPAKAANRGDYRAIGLTDPEITTITERMPAMEKRTVLLKREDESLVLRFDLTGMDDEITVLSGRLEAMPAFDRLRAEHGDDPRDFLEPWLEEAKRIAARTSRETEDA